MRKVIAVAAVLLACRTGWAAVPLSSFTEAGWTRTIASVGSFIRGRLPLNREVHMTIDHSSSMTAAVTEPSMGIRLFIDDAFNPYRISGDFDATANLQYPRDSRYGADILGGGVNVSIRPFGGTTYLLDGIYNSPNSTKKKSSDLHIPISAHFRDMDVHQPGMDLEIRWNAGGYQIDGTVDERRFDKKALAILGAAVAVVTRSEFWRPQPR